MYRYKNYGLVLYCYYIKSNTTLIIIKGTAFAVENGNLFNQLLSLFEWKAFLVFKIRKAVGPKLCHNRYYEILTKIKHLIYHS